MFLLKRLELPLQTLKGDLRNPGGPGWYGKRAMAWSPPRKPLGELTTEAYHSRSLANEDRLQSGFRAAHVVNHHVRLAERKAE